MKAYHIQSLADQSLLFTGVFKNFRACVETAIDQGVSLAEADLRGRNLSFAMLDGGVFDAADFSGSNLCGANLSEIAASGSVWNDADLTGACLAYSDLSAAVFRATQFGATDIAGCDLRRALFIDCPSCFHLNFSEALSMQGAYYICGPQAAPMSHPPLVMLGLAPGPVTMLDSHVLYRGELIERNYWLAQFKSCVR
ncbi:MAG: pentapeptide repeat-containing protein [Alphaproteobacteria bacterium]|nr:pentapeptide repeat-containing protein [Alphaproteobacteria bacterium]